MLVEVDDKQIYISGEATVTPAFYADKKSMVRWDKPFENIELTDYEKNQIINYIQEESKRRGIEVIFE